MGVFSKKQIINILKEIDFNQFTELKNIPEEIDFTSSSELTEELNRVIELYYNRIV